MGLKKLLIFTYIDIDYQKNIIKHIPWSIDFKTLAFGKFLQEKGWDVYLYNRDPEKGIMKVNFGATEFIQKTNCKITNFDLLFIGCDYLLNDYWNLIKNGIKSKFNILSIPAIHWIEDPDFFDMEIIKMYSLHLRNNIDLIVTSNRRMQLYMQEFWYLTAGFPKDRIKVIKLGFNEDGLIDREIARKKYIKCKNNDIVIVNSGGIWSWTDFNSFLLGFIKAVRYGNKNLKLYIMGKKQKDNFSEDNIKYIKELNKILEKNKDLINKNIFVNEWSPIEKINKFVGGADIGINVNKDTLENMFSSRVRVTDYIKAGIPIISTYGDEMSEFFKENNIGWQVKPGDIEGYFNILKDLTYNEINIMRARIRKIRNNFKWENQIKVFFEENESILYKPLRPNSPNHIVDVVNYECEYLPSRPWLKSNIIEKTILINKKEAFYEYLQETPIRKIFLKFIKIYEKTPFKIKIKINNILKFFYNYRKKGTD